MPKVAALAWKETLLKKPLILLLVFLAFLGAAIGVMFLLGNGSHPLNRPAGLGLRASAQAYEFSADFFDDRAEIERHTVYAAVFSEYLKDLPPGSMVVELGSGNGSFLAQFRNRGWKLMGIDLSTSGVRWARKRFPDMRFEVADATEDLSRFNYGTFDAVISSEVIEHIFLPRKYTANCFKLLKPGGRLVISTPYHGYLKNLALAVAGRSYGGGLRTPLWDFGHIKFWSVDTLSQLLFEAGFEHLEWRGQGRFPYLWKGLIMKASVPHRATAD
jgi:SAM-dependent methyltransferase